jgi:hypothetical protein
LLRILRTALALDTQLESTAPLRASLLRTLAEGLTKAGKSLPREDRAFEPVLRTLAAWMNESLGRLEDARTTPGANILHTHLDVEVLVALLDLEHSLLAARLSDVVFLLGSAGVTSSCPDVCLRLLRGLVSVYARLRQLPELLSTFFGACMLDPKSQLPRLLYLCQGSLLEGLQGLPSGQTDEVWNITSLRLAGFGGSQCIECQSAVLVPLVKASLLLSQSNPSADTQSSVASLFKEVIAAASSRITD